MTAALPASYLYTELEHLLEVVDALPEAERAEFMTTYLEGLLFPEPELVEAFNDGAGA